MLAASLDAYNRRFSNRSNAMQRDRIEADIHNMLDDVEADGTPLDSKRPVEDALSASHNQRNHDVGQIYASMH